MVNERELEVDCEQKGGKMASDPIGDLLTLLKEKWLPNEQKKMIESMIIQLVEEMYDNMQKGETRGNLPWR